MATKKENQRKDVRIVRKREKEAFKQGSEVPASKMSGRVHSRGYGSNIVDK